MFKKIEKNTSGRDFLCSDIHGCYSVLSETMAAHEFNQDRDRLFCLGDLIDRGPDSQAALSWLAQPWFYSIQGNHERMLINAMDDASNSLWNQWMYWGGDWAEDLGLEQLELFYKAFTQLPLAVELELSNGKRIGLVHGELPNECNWDDVLTTLKNLTPQDVEKNKLTSDMLWRKSQPYLPAYESAQVLPVRGIDHIFHGHTIVADYLTIGNRTFMDLGAYQIGEIGFIEPLKYL